MKSNNLNTIFLLGAVVFLMTINSAYAQTIKTSTNEKTVEIKITGMTCSGCSNHVSNVLKETPGVIDNFVKYPGDIAEIKYDANKVSPAKIAEAIEAKTSYTAEVIENKDKKKS